MQKQKKKMLKNLSDYLTFATLIFGTFYALRMFVFAFARKEEEDNRFSRRQLLKDYINNDEE